LQKIVDGSAPNLGSLFKTGLKFVGEIYSYKDKIC